MRIVETTSFSTRAISGCSLLTDSARSAAVFVCTCVLLFGSAKAVAQQSRPDLQSSARNPQQAASRHGDSPTAASQTTVSPAADPRLRAVLKSMTQPRNTARPDTARPERPTSDYSNTSSPVSSDSSVSSAATTAPAASPWYRSSDPQPPESSGPVEPLQPTPDSFMRESARDLTSGSATAKIRTAGYSESSDSGALNQTETPITPVAAKKTEMFLDLGEEETSVGGSRLNGSATSDTSEESLAEVSMSSSPTQVIMRAVAWLVIALCLFSLAALGVRHWQRQKGLLPSTGSRSRILETLSLGPGRSVSLIEISGYRAFVAFDTTGIKQLVLAPQSFSEAFPDNDTAPESGRGLDDDDPMIYTARAPDVRTPDGSGDS